MIIGVLSILLLGCNNFSSKSTTYYYLCCDNDFLRTFGILEPNLQHKVVFSMDGRFSLSQDGLVLWEGTYEFTKNDTIKCLSLKEMTILYFTVNTDKKYIKLNGTGNIYVNGDNTLVGKYYIAGDVPAEYADSYLEFKQDNTFWGYQLGQTMNGEYIFDGTYVYLSSSLGPAVKIYNVSDDKKTLSFVDDPTQQWKKK